MLLLQVRLKNIGLYRGEHTVTFSTDSQRPITLIGGENGAGKTTLLNAIPLVLYGNRAKMVIGSSAYPEFLQGLIHQGEQRASIALDFERRERGETARYQVEREWARSANGKSTGSLYVTVDGKPRPDLEANWPEFVEGIMPISVSGLAIFDGEKIEALADVSSSAEILRTSLFGLLGLDLVDRLRRDLAEYRRKVAHQAAPPHDGLHQRLTEAEDRLAVSIADVDAAQSELEPAEREMVLAAAGVASATDRLAKAGGDLFANREQHHAELASAEASIAANHRRLETLAAGDLPLLMVRSLLEQVVGMGERHQIAKEGALLLDRMKERDERVLEQVASAGHVFSNEVVELLGKLLQEDRGIYEVDHQGTFDVTDSATDAARELLGGFGSELLAEATTLQQEIAISTDLAFTARRSLESVPSGEAIYEVERGLARAEATLAAASASLAALVDRANEAERRRTNAQREVERLATEVLEAGAVGNDAMRIGREIDRAETTLERFSARVVARHIERIGQNISDSLQDLMRKDGLVSRMAIDPESLHLSLFGREDREIDPSKLSAGERQILATAVLWGLSKSTGRSLPTVIDTPVGRLDRSHRTNLVTRYFPHASRQVILLSTDEEIVGKYLDHLKPHVGAMYLLDHDETEDVTRVTEGYFE